MALFLFTVGFQPERVPSRLANRKREEPDADPSETSNPVPLVLNWSARSPPTAPGALREFPGGGERESPYSS
jgi:hypothetical protein